MTSQTNEVIPHLRRAVLLREGTGLTDEQLLENYIERRDDGALEALVRRHGAMVWGVCRRVLHNHHDAEDAFQATFLVFVRKAATIATRELLANWLYGVAYQTARKARATAAKRSQRERQVAEMPEPDAAPLSTWDDLQGLLDQELTHLPTKYRVVVVLCDLQGKTRKETAQELGWPEGTVAGRLARAREMLADRLARRGVGLSGAAVALALSQNSALACAPPSLISFTIKVANSFATDQAGSAVALSTQVAVLYHGVLKAMLTTRITFNATIAAMILFVAGAGAVLLHAATRPNVDHSQSAVQKTQPQTQRPKATGKTAKPRIIKLGGALFRMAWSPGDSTIGTVSYTVTKVKRVIRGKNRTVSRFNSTAQFWNDKGKPKLSLGEETGVRIESIAFSPDGKLVAIAALTGITGRGDAYEIRLMEPRTGALKKTIKQADTVRAVAFSPNGKMLAIGGAVLPTNLKGPFYRIVRLWDLDKGKVTKKIKKKLQLQQGDPYLDGLRDLTFSRDGKLLAIADADARVRLLDAQTGKLFHTLEGHANVAFAVAFSPDGKLLVTGGFDQTVRVWNVKTGKELRIIQDNQGPVMAVAFSPNGKLLATGAKEVILWDTSTWEQKKTLASKTGRIAALVFSPGNGGTLAVAAGGQVRLWPLNGTLRKNK